MNETFRAVQHLLRHLNDLPGLRTNALVAHLFDRDKGAAYAVHKRIRSVVVHALEQTAEAHGVEHGATRPSRWYAIIQRCDLGDEPHDAVAAELGLSERQFYRERRWATESIADAVVRGLNAIAQQHDTPPDEAELMLEYAAGLRSYGRVADATRTLEEVATHAPDPAHRLAAIAALIELDVAHATADTLPLLVRRRLAVAATCDVPGSAELALAQAYAAQALGENDEYREKLELTFALSASTPVPTPRSHHIEATALLRLGEYATEFGDAAASQRYLATALQTIDRDPVRMAGVRARYYFDLGDLERFQMQYRRSIAAYAEALALARGQNPWLVMSASLALGLAQMQRGALTEAELHARNALALAGVGDVRMGAAAMNVLADVELRRGRPQAAIDVFHQLRRRYPHDDPERYFEDLVFADALDRIGRHAEALVTIDEACRGLELWGLPRYIGYAQRLRAQIYWNARRHRDARESLDRALQILEEHGAIRALGEAYALSARINKNARHRERAREITRHLQAVSA